MKKTVHEILDELIYQMGDVLLDSYYKNNSIVTKTQLEHLIKLSDEFTKKANEALDVIDL